MKAFQDMLLGPLKAVLMRVLQQQLSKYIHNIELEELGLMGGDVVLENLELRKDVLHDIGGISTDYDFSRGYIKELRIHIPWTRLQSRAIEIKVKTVEIIITPVTQTASKRSSSTWQHSRHGSRSTDEQASPAGASGWMQQLLTKVLANMSIEVSNLVLKYEDADVVLSAALKSLVCFSAHPDREWTPAFASLDDSFGFLHKLVRASDLTVCLDRYCAPDPARRRQVQAFEVPILNRASFEVRLLACVWLVAPGPSESSLAAWEDQQAQVEWQGSVEVESAGIPPSPGKSGARWGRQWGVKEAPKPPPAPKSLRPPVTVLGRLVGGDRRSVSGDESAMDLSGSGATPADVEGEVDELPIPSVCRLLRDGWSRRASSSYSPFFDGGAAWSRGEAAGVSTQEEEQEEDARAPASFGGEGRVGEEVEEVWSGGGEGLMMPVPIVSADVTIADLSFSLSNLQVQMVTELVDRAVCHVARNARRNTPVEPVGPRPPVLNETAPVASSWWPSFWRGSAPESCGRDPHGHVGETANGQTGDGPLGGSSPVSFESRESDTNFVVASLSIGSVSLSLLEHQEQAAGGELELREVEEEAVEDEEAESISVPVHGLGTVSVRSAPVSARKQTLPPPVAFVVAKVQGIVIDAHVLPGDNELAADVKLEVSSVVVRHARLDDTVASPDRSPDKAETAKRLDSLEPVVSVGASVTSGASMPDGKGGGTSADTSKYFRSAPAVQQCLVEIAGDSPQADPADGETGNNTEFSGGENTPFRRQRRAPAQDFPSSSPVRWSRASTRTTTPQPAPKECALQYRLLKQRASSTPNEGSPRGGGGPDAAVSAVPTLTCHDIAVGALRVQLGEVLVEKLLRFSGLVRRQNEREEERAGDPAGETSGESNIVAPPLTAAPVSLVQVQGQPTRARRLSPRASHSSLVSGQPSPRALPSRSPTFSLETSLHFVLHSVDVALDLSGAQGGYEAGQAEVVFCVLSVSHLEASGSTSASYLGEKRRQQHRGGEHSTVAWSEQMQDEESQTVCTLILGKLLVTLVDYSALVAEEIGPLVVSGPPTLMSRSLAQGVFLAGGGATGVRRLVGLDGARATAEILSKPDEGPGGAARSAVGNSAARDVPDFLFNASLESVEVCASVGAALLALEVCLLANKMTEKHSRAGDTGGTNALRTRWRNGWCHGVGASFEGISVGGVAKSGGGQLTGNLRRLRVGRVGGGVLPSGELFASTSDVAVFEALLGEGNGEGLSWAVDISDHAGLTGVKLTSSFKSATLHYSNAKKAYFDVVSMMNEWKVGAARLVANSSAAVERRSRPFEFDIRGSAVALHLPFELELEVEGVRLRTPLENQAPVGGRGGERAVGDLDINLTAGDVRVYHLPYGTHCSPEDGGPTAIRCAARGIVTVRPSTNATAVSLHSEHVHVRLTPAFCASFGLFVRFMVGPPPRPLPAESALAIAARDRPPVSFTFELKVRTVDVDFLTGLCNPSAVSAAFVVRGVSMRQHATGSAAPEAGSQACFEMSFEAVEATQRRDPWLDAPALPQKAVQLIGTFVGKVSKNGGHSGAPGAGLFSAWLSTRKRAEGGSGRIGTCYTQPFLVALGTSSSGQAFYVKTTSSGPRHRAVNSLSLRLAPVLLVCYPPTFRILVGHYNRFAANAFRMHRSRADMPRRRIAVISYDIDIRGCSSVLLASLVDGARGLQLSAGEVTFKENTAARATAGASPAAGVGVSHGSSPSLAGDTLNAADATLAMSGYTGPVGIVFLQDWRLALPSHVRPGGDRTAAGVQLCAPIDLRWAVLYDHLDRCRQDVSLSSVQFYLEQPHFDLCVRVAQIFVAADYPGALPPKLPPLSAEHSARTSTSAADEAAGSSKNPKVEFFLATSLRLPLLQFVLANGKRNGPFPPVLEFDMASVRLARGGVLTVRHLSVNSWSQDVDTPMRPQVSAQASARGSGSGCGYRVLGRAGQSEESGKDFLRMEVRVPEMRTTRPGTPDPRRPQLDVVFQVQPFDVHINPSVLRSLTAYIAPVPFVEGSPEDLEVPFPQRHPLLVTPRRSNGNPPPSAARDGDGTAPGSWRGSSAGERVSTDFEKSAMTASASVRLLASQVSLELSSYPGGPAFMASTSHIFLRAITWPSDAIRARGSGEGGIQAGPEVFARLSRVSCRVRCADGSRALAAGAGASVADAVASQNDGRVGDCSPRGDTVLKPFDVDVHLTRPRASAAPAVSVGTIAPEFSVAQGWHAGVYVDELYLRFGALHTRSLEFLADVFLPAVAAAELTAVELARGRHACGTASGRQGQSGGRADDLLTLDRVECPEFAGEASAVKPGYGQAVFYGVGAHRQGSPEGSQGASTGVSAPEGKEGENEKGDDGWVHCCEWRYWGLRRVAQIALPYAPLCGSVPLLEGLVLDSLEVELSFVDPLSGVFKEATRFNVPCRSPDEPSNELFVGRPHITVEASQPILARTWRLSWRIPTWLRFKAAGVGGAPKPSAISAWSALLLRALSVRSSPAGPMVGPSYVSATLVAQRLTLALVTPGGPVAPSSLSSSPSPMPLSGGGERRGLFQQPEEIVRVVVGDVNVFAEADAAAKVVSVAARGSAVVAVDVQDFSNFLRLPLLSHAVVNFDVSTSSGGGGGGSSDIAGDDGENLLSPFRPVVSSALEVRNAVISISVTAVQCIDQCIAELAQRPPGVVVETDESVARRGNTAENAEPPALAKPTPLPIARRSRMRSKRYVITNHTDRNLWFGQVSTTETLCLRAGEESPYRWRTIPALVPGPGGRKGGSSRLVLMLRISLQRDSGSGGGYNGPGARSGGGCGEWTEPFPADDEGMFMRLLWGDEAGRPAGAEVPGAGPAGSNAVMLPLWVEVTKEGLETRIAFRGEWVFTNHLPQEIQVAWVTSAGVGNAGRRLVEPAGTRGALNLMACEPHKEAAKGSGDTVEVLRPVSCSALTASSTPSGARQGQGRLSELMLEFRLATPDAAAFVGSVGPPPIATEDSVAHEMKRGGTNSSSGDGGRANSSRGAGKDLGDQPQGREEDETDSISGTWGVTRQSEWVQARPSVFLALISCASTDPGISGFVFWCVASRQASHLNDCAACVSRAVGHCGHLGQMRIDLHPVALVWNYCSQPMRAVLNHGSGGDRWSERPAEPVEPRESEDKVVAGNGYGADCERTPQSTYSLSRSTAAIEPGGRTAVCQQPFVDYDLEVASMAATAQGSDSQALPFLVSVPSELLSHRCKSTWLPLHSRALTDDVLCPLVVVASRLLDSDWPSLSLRVYPGLSVQNYLSVPLSLRTVFARPSHGVIQVPSMQPGEEGNNGATAASEGTGCAPIEDTQHAAEPLLRRKSSGASESTSIDGDGDGGNGVIARVARVFRVPAESCYSAWDMLHSDGFPIPFLLPEVSLELGLDSQAAAGVGPSLVSSERTVEVPASLVSPDLVTRHSRKLNISLENDLNELVLIPWETASECAVLPVFMTLERDAVLGGVELIRLVVHPRVVVHNATGLPVSLSLLGAPQTAGGQAEGGVGLSGRARNDAFPLCRVHLTPEGNGSSMNLLAIPGQCVRRGLNDSFHGSPRRPPAVAAAAAAAAAAAGRGGVTEPDFPPDTGPSPGLLGKLSRMLKSGRNKPVSPHPAGFYANLEVAFGRDDAEHAPASRDTCFGSHGAPATTPTGRKATSTDTTGRSLRSSGVDGLAVFSLREHSAGSALVSQPSSLTLRSCRAQAVRVCVAGGSHGTEPTTTSPTRHVLLYKDPQPDLTICNRSAGYVTLLFDCGALVEVGPGGTEEHSWEPESNARDRSSSSKSSTSARRQTPPVSAPGRRGRNWSESSPDAAGDMPNTPAPSTPTRISPVPGSPAATNSGAGVPPDGRRSCISNQSPRTPRPPGKLGGDATLQHWFQCKGGSKDDALSSWSDPLWVARGVQVMRFDGQFGSSDNKEDLDYHESAQSLGDDSDDGSGFGAGSAREVQVHVVERAGGFVMSFAEGGFEGAPATGVSGVERDAGDSTAENRGVLRRWAATPEQHVVITVSGTTLQLLDDSNLQAVAAAGEEKSSAARRTLGRPSTMDGWMGGSWEEPGGLLSDGASVHLPAAAIPAILSVFVDASSVRLWRAAPAVRPGMSSLDLERSWHVKDRVGIDVCLDTLQIDNHVVGHRLPVLFCFRKGGRLVHGTDRNGGDGEAKGGCRFAMSLVLAEAWEHGRVPSYVEKVSVRSSPIDVCFEDSLLPPLLLLLERAGVGGVFGDGLSSSYPFAAGGDRRSNSSSARGGDSLEGGPQLLPPALGASMVPRLFIQRVDIGALVVRATVQGYIPGKQVFLALDKSPLLFRPVSLRGVLARPDEIAEQIATNYAVDALLRSLAVVGSLEALGSPTTLLSEWGKGVYDLFAMPIKAMPQGPSSTVRATFRGVSSLLRHASAGTLSSVSGVTNALSRNLGSQVVRPIAGTMGLVHRTSKSLIASIGVDSEWTHAQAAAAATPATAYLNADLWYRCCLLPAEHEFLYRTPALCSNASYSQANVPVTIVLSSKAVFLYRGGSGCETLWKQIEHQDITLVEQSAEHAPAELILNARGYRRPRSATSPLAATHTTMTAAAVTATSPPRARSPVTPAAAAAAAARAAADTAGVPARSGGAASATLEAEEVAIGGLLMKLSLPSSACCRELAQLLHGLSDKA